MSGNTRVSRNPDAWPAEMYAIVDGKLQLVVDLDAVYAARKAYYERNRPKRST